jgi:V/A-type H+/Na+-transporting ATPase subunit I
MILKMRKIQIIGMRVDALRVVNLLHQLGCMQIDDFRNNAEMDLLVFPLSEEQRKSREELSTLITTMNGEIEILQHYDNLKDKINSQGKKLTIDLIKREVKNLSQKLQELTINEKKVEEELETLPRYLDTLRKILPKLPPSSAVREKTLLVGLVARGDNRLRDTLTKPLQEILPGNYELGFSALNEDMEVIQIVIPITQTQFIEKLFEKEGISKFILPADYSQLPPEKILENLQENINHIHQHKHSIQHQFHQLALGWLINLNHWRQICQDALEEYEVLDVIGSTNLTFVLYGWIPEEEIKNLKDKLTHEIGKGVWLNTLRDLKKMAMKTPVAMKNSTILAPYESLVKMRAIPRYDDIDPSLLTAIFLPMFFGMMVGDIGYGIILWLISLFLIRSMAKGLLQDIVKVLNAGSLWAVLFGFLYGEFLGDLGKTLGLKPIWIDRANPSSLITLMTAAIGEGAFHITLGLIVGVVNAVKHGNRTHLYERGGMLAGIIGILILIAVLRGIFPIFLEIPAGLMIIAGVVLIGISLGKTGVVVGPIEMVSLIGNILSYLRLAAVGLASVYLGMVANHLVGRLGSVAIGLVAAVIIHALNLIMAGFSPLIHSLRLHYVEFYRKFYEGGQNAFIPFKQHIDFKSK